MKTASTLLLAAALVGGASCKRVLQDIPEVGLGPSRPATSSSSQAESSSTATSQEEEELIDALEADDQITGKMNTDLHDPIHIPLYASCVLVKLALVYIYAVAVSSTRLPI